MASGGRAKYWREAASLIMVAPLRKQAIIRNKTDVRTCNFSVLMLKRGNESSFLPNAYAYPGGVTSCADFDGRGWLRVFKRLPGFTDLTSLQTPFKIPGVRPPMMTNRPCSDHKVLPPEIAFRICAIRETFEETGLLLVCNTSDVEFTTRLDRLRGKVPPMATIGSKFDEKEWRNRVSGDASQLQDLCLTCDVVPNIWALYEWRNWLTPVFFRVTKPPSKPKRFDTMFFVCSLNAVPEQSQLYTNEIAKAEWKSPVEWFKLAEDHTVTFVGPQIKETSLLASFSNITDFLGHVYNREPLGCLCWMPVNYRCTDGIIVTLPGDELYPENPDYEGTKDLLELDVSVKTACLQARRLHRFVFGTLQFYINVDMPCGHVVDIFAQRTFPKDFSFSKM